MTDQPQPPQTAADRAKARLDALVAERDQFIVKEYDLLEEQERALAPIMTRLAALNDRRAQVAEQVKRYNAVINELKGVLTDPAPADPPPPADPPADPPAPPVEPPAPPEERVERGKPKH
jgi:hypothetical protein